MIRTLYRRQRRLLHDQTRRIRNCKHCGSSDSILALVAKHHRHRHHRYVSTSSLNSRPHQQHSYSTTSPYRQSSAAAATMLSDDDDHDDHGHHHHQHSEEDEEELFVRTSLSQFLIPELRQTAHLLSMEDYEHQQQQVLDRQPHEDTLDDPMRHPAAASVNHTAFDFDTRITSWDESPWKDELLQDEHDTTLLQELEEQHRSTPFAEMLGNLHEDPDNPTMNEEDNHLNKSFVELLQTFDPQNPPKLEDYATKQEALEHIQLWLECEAQQEAVLRYQDILQSARERKDYGSLHVVQKLIAHWIPPLTEAFEKLQKDFLCKSEEGTVPSLKKFGPYMCVLPARKLAVIALHESIMATVTVNGSDHGMPVSSLTKRIGNAVEQEVLIHRLLRQRFLAAQQGRKEQKASESLAEEGDPSEALEANDDLLAKFYHEKIIASGGGKEFTNTDIDSPATVQSKTGETKESVMSSAVTRNLHRWSYASSHLKSLLDEISVHNPAAAQRQRNIAFAVKKARQAEDTNEPWEVTQIVQLGAALFKTIMDTCTVPVKFGGSGKEDSLFQVHKLWMLKKRKFKSFAVLNDDLYKMIVDDQMQSLAAVSTRHKPMVVPPQPWKSEGNGGYRVLQVDIMRYACPTQRRSLQEADIETVIDGLNSLGRVRWRVNGSVLDIAQECWDSKLPVGTDIPSRADLTVPPEPLAPKREDLEKDTPKYKEKTQEYLNYREKMIKYTRLKQKNLVRDFGTIALVHLTSSHKGLEIFALYCITETATSREVS